MHLLAEEWLLTEEYLEPDRTSTMELFCEMLNGFKLLTIFAKKGPLQMFEWVENRLLSKNLKH